MAKKSDGDQVPQLINERLGELLRLPVGSVDMGELDPAATPGFKGDKDDAEEITEALAPELGEL